MSHPCTHPSTGSMSQAMWRCHAPCTARVSLSFSRVRWCLLEVVHQSGQQLVKVDILTSCNAFLEPVHHWGNAADQTVTSVSLVIPMVVSAVCPSRPPLDESEEESVEVPLVENGLRDEVLLLEEL